MTQTNPKTRLQRIQTAIASGKKRTFISMINILLQSELGEEYQKSNLKDEQYIITSEKFVNAVSNARKRLDLDDDTKVPKSWITNLKQGKVWDADDLDFDKYHIRYSSEVTRAVQEAGLSKDWYLYMSDYIVNMKPPKSKRNLFLIPSTIRVEDINGEGEIVIRIKPGLRYEDYRKSWKVFARYLGSGTRLSKPYTSTDSFSMYQDKQDGMSYRQIAQKHFPNADPALTIDRVKKAVNREKKRLLGDKLN